MGVSGASTPPDLVEKATGASGASKSPVLSVSTPAEVLMHSQAKGASGASTPPDLVDKAKGASGVSKSADLVDLSVDSDTDADPKAVGHLISSIASWDAWTCNPMPKEYTLRCPKCGVAMNGFWWCINDGHDDDDGLMCCDQPDCINILRKLAKQRLEQWSKTLFPNAASYRVLPYEEWRTSYLRTADLFHGKGVSGASTHRDAVVPSLSGPTSLIIQAYHR
jgi:hypothetical protein